MTAQADQIASIIASLQSELAALQPTAAWLERIAAEWNSPTFMDRERARIAADRVTGLGNAITGWTLQLNRALLGLPPL